MREGQLAKLIDPWLLRSLRPTRVQAGEPRVPGMTMRLQTKLRPPFPGWPEQSMAEPHLAGYESEVSAGHWPQALAQPGQNHIREPSVPGRESNVHIPPN